MRAWICAGAVCLCMAVPLFPSQRAPQCPHVHISPPPTFPPYQGAIDFAVRIDCRDLGRPPRAEVLPGLTRDMVVRADGTGACFRQFWGLFGFLPCSCLLGFVGRDGLSAPTAQVAGGGLGAG